MKFLTLLFFFILLLVNGVKAKNVNSSDSDSYRNVERLSKLSFLNTKDTLHLGKIIQAENGFFIALEEDSIPPRKVKFKRGKAILFTIFTGFLGGHRIYFGTHHRTPIIYSITFGGLGILPLIDLVHIIFTKDLSKFEHKSQIIMWGK